VPPEPPQERVEFRFGGRVILDGVSVQARIPPAGPEMTGARPTAPVNELPPITETAEVPWVPALAVTEVGQAVTVKSAAVKTVRAMGMVLKPLPARPDDAARMVRV
jgi:hypothetical protein